jgi:hypothetical protein
LTAAKQKLIDSGKNSTAYHQFQSTDGRVIQNKTNEPNPADGLTSFWQM